MKKIMFNDEYGQTDAVLDGRKTQTRRIITCPERCRGIVVRGFHAMRNVAGNIVEICMYDKDERDIDGGLILPKYNVGEFVAVAQNYASIVDELENPKNFYSMEDWESAAPKRAHYAEFLHHPGMTNKMFVSADEMPHQIRFKALWAERLQDISDEDCIKEGVEKVAECDNLYRVLIFHKSGRITDLLGKTPREAYAALIDKISGKGTWQNNPYVFAYVFELVK